MTSETTFRRACRQQTQAKLKQDWVSLECHCATPRPARLHAHPSLRQRHPPKQGRPKSGCFNRLAVELLTVCKQHHEQILQRAPTFEIVSAVTTSSCSTYACKQSCGVENRLLQLSTSTDKLQSVMNAAAKIVCSLKKYDHIKQHMRDTLHWLLVPQRVTYKLCLLTYKTIHSKAPEYLIELCKPVAESESRHHLISASTWDLLVPRTTTSFADRAFACRRTKSLEQSTAGTKENKNTRHV